MYTIKTGADSRFGEFLSDEGSARPVLGMSDRVVVMREGRAIGELSRAQATAERVISLATSR